MKLWVAEDPIGVLSADGESLVGRAIVDYYNLYSIARDLLGKNAVEAASNEPLFIVRWDDDGKRRGFARSLAHVVWKWMRLRQSNATP
jgi:hypothetical protein